MKKEEKKDTKEKKILAVKVQELQDSVDKNPTRIPVSVKLGTVKLLKEMNFDLKKTAEMVGVTVRQLRAWREKYGYVLYSTDTALEKKEEGAIKIVAKKSREELEKSMGGFINKCILAQEEGLDALRQAYPLCDDPQKIANAIKTVHEVYSALTGIGKPSEQLSEQPQSQYQNVVYTAIKEMHIKLNAEKPKDNE